MAIKIVLFVAAAFLAQGFADPIEIETSYATGHIPPVTSEEIRYVFEEIMYDIDFLREMATLTALEVCRNENDTRVIIACFRSQASNFLALGKRMNEMIYILAETIGKDLGDKFDKYAEKAQEPLRVIASTLRTLPSKVYELIKEKEYIKALELVREARTIVLENAKILIKILKELDDELPEVAEKAEKMIIEIREEAKQRSNAIAEEIKKCIEQGGPQNIDASSEESGSGSESEESKESESEENYFYGKF